MQTTTPCCAPLLDESMYPGMAITPDGAAAFQDFLTHEVAPFLSSHLPLHTAGLAILGVSLGGLFALYAILRRPTR